MTSGPSTSLRNLRTLLSGDFKVVDVTSNDTHIVVALRDGERVEMVTLDASDARILLKEGWLDHPDAIPA